MAKNTGNNRIAIKWIRDKAKSAYEKANNCCICNTTEDLELHHTHSLTLLFEKWTKTKGYTITTDEDILAVREEFIEEHKREIYDAVYTLCNKHHVALHAVYGKAPALNTADKQSRWIEIQKSKLANGGTEPSKPHPSISPFAAFY